MDEQEARARRIIDRLQAKADATEYPGEKEAITERIRILKSTYRVDSTPPFAQTPEEVMQRLFGTNPHTTYRFIYIGNQPPFSTYAWDDANLDEQPERDENGWQSLD